MPQASVCSLFFRNVQRNVSKIDKFSEIGMEKRGWLVAKKMIPPSSGNSGIKRPRFGYDNGGNGFLAPGRSPGGPLRYRRQISFNDSASAVRAALKNFNFCNFLAGSFSAVSKPNFARKYAFFSIFQALTRCAPLQLQHSSERSV